MTAPLVELKRTLTPNELAIVSSEMATRRKSVGVVYALWFFLGGLGAHWFYLGERWRALTYWLMAPAVFLVTVVVWGLYPAIACAWIVGVVLAVRLLCEAFTLGRHTERVNVAIESALIAEVTGRRRPVPPAPTDYGGRLDALVHTRAHENRWRRWRRWGLGAALSVPMVIGLVRLLPIQQKPSPAVPVPTLTPEGKQRQELPAPAETPESVRSSSNFVVMPGKLVGNFSLGMTREEILKIAPKPQETFPDRLVYKSQKTGNALVMHVQNNKTVQIDFTSKDFYTREGIHTGNFWDVQYAALFDVQERPGTSPRRTYTLKTGGLTFYDNADSRARAIGVVYAGPQPISEVQSIAGEVVGQVQGAPQQRINGLLAGQISLVKKGGVYEIPVELNGVITLPFVLDTGAAEVHIPADVAVTLYRTGTIRDTDFLPGKMYRLADGSMVSSSRLLLRSLKIGKSHLTDVPASIGAVSSPLLLGQSLLERLGAWSMDSQKQVLTIGARTQPGLATPQGSGGSPPLRSSAPSPIETALASPLSKAVGNTVNNPMPAASVGVPTTTTGDTYIIEYLDPDNLKPRYSTERKVIAVSAGAITVAAKNLQSKTGKARILLFTSEWNLLSSRNPDGSGFDYSPPLKYFDAHR